MTSKTLFNGNAPTEKLKLGNLPAINESNQSDDDDEFHDNGVFNAVSSVVRFRNLRKKHLVQNPGIRRFERRYTELGPLLKPEQRRVDFILIYRNKSSQDEDDPVERESLEEKEYKRERFKNALKLEGFLIQETVINDNVFVKLHCPFKRLCAEAEMVKLELPLRGCDKSELKTGFFTKFIDDHFETDDEVDFVSAPFVMDRIQLYEGYEDPTHFFRSSVRSMLVYHILMNVDIRTKEDKDRKVLQIRGLPYLMMKNVYTDAFPLHEESNKSKENEDTMKEFFKAQEEEEVLDTDPRKDLDEAWMKFFKFQPLWKIRNYFGEKIALYFAWTGMLTSTLWIPTIFGFAIFLYGLINSRINEDDPLEFYGNETEFEKIKMEMNALLDDVRRAFDNSVTPYFALVICLWGTVFLELWKRTNATLAYEWDVDNFETNEPDRPQFFGLKVKKDPITEEDNWVYPFKRLVLKYTGSTMVVIFMIIVVFACVLGVIVYRVFMGVDYCPGKSAVECLMITTVFSSILNGVAILILGKLYDKLAVILTDWENHRTQSRYDDALIIKVFAFQFANTYASCFYIAFFRGKFEIFDLGPDYVDTCSETCMSQLSFQVMVLMLIKPVPKFLKDIILPTVRRLWRNRPNWFCRCRICFRYQCCRNKVADEESNGDDMDKMHFEYVENERLKPDLGDFTLGEYTEKILQYGFLMLFAASFPLAPLLALLTNAVDIRIDAKRLLWMYRRPVAEIRGDIGKWYGILQFVNLCGVITNAFIIAFTSKWGQDYTTTEKLWFVIGFEHIVFTLKFLLAYLIPDVPSSVALDIRREKFQIAKLLGTSTLSKGGSHEIVDYSHLVPKHSAKRRSRSSNYDTFNEAEETMKKELKKKTDKEKKQDQEKQLKEIQKDAHNENSKEGSASDLLNESFNTAVSVSGIQPTTPKDSTA